MAVVKRPTELSKWYLPGVFVGIGITVKHLFSNLFNQKQMPTYNYPEQKYNYSPRFKGNHVLTVRKDGAIRCTACMLCATNCPAQCIHIIAAENPDPTVEKYPISYEIDVLRCVYCGFCEEACPVDAIRMGPEWQAAGMNGSNFVYGIGELAHRPQLKGGILSVCDDQERHSEGI